MTLLIVAKCLRQGNEHFTKAKDFGFGTKMPSFLAPFLVIFPIL